MNAMLYASFHDIIRNLVGRYLHVEFPSNFFQKIVPLKLISSPPYLIAGNNEDPHLPETLYLFSKGVC